MPSSTETLTIMGGTRRLVGASGMLAVRRALEEATGESSGSIAGSMTMQH